MKLNEYQILITLLRLLNLKVLGRKAAILWLLRCSCRKDTQNILIYLTHYNFMKTDWRNDEYSEIDLDEYDNFEETHGNYEAEHCKCGAYIHSNGQWLHVSDCNC